MYMIRLNGARYFVGMLSFECSSLFTYGLLTKLAGEFQHLDLACALRLRPLSRLNDARQLFCSMEVLNALIPAFIMRMHSIKMVYVSTHRLDVL